MSLNRFRSKSDTLLKPDPGLEKSQILPGVGYNMFIFFQEIIYHKEIDLNIKFRGKSGKHFYKIIVKKYICI